MWRVHASPRGDALPRQYVIKLILFIYLLLLFKNQK